MKEKVWVENFKIDKSGYHLITPTFKNFKNCQEILLGKGNVILKEMIAVWDGVDLIAFYEPEKELEKLENAIIETIYMNPAKAEDINKETYKINDRYFNYAKEILDLNLEELSNEELGSIYKELIKNQKKGHQHSLSTTWFSDGYKQNFSKKLMKRTEELIEGSNSDLDVADTFSKLTTDERNGFVINEEIESLKFAQQISEDETAKKLFAELEDFSKIPDGLNPVILAGIEKHHQKWRWLPFNYMGPAYNIDTYLQIWSGLIKEKTDLDKAIAKLENRPSEVKKKREELVQKLSISKEDMRIFDLAADISYLKGHRKEIMYHGFYALDKILREMGKRIYLSLNQMHLLSYWEVQDIFIDGQDIDLQELSRRAKKAVMYYNGEDVKILTAKEADDFLSDKNIKEEEIDENLKELQGTCACSGQAKGKVKIVNSPEEMSKMEAGDVMVSHTTYPALVPAMKKAAAIITEDGGITCHAAIVSREMGTPCITGINIATKVLKDGDKVEVDANKGIVKKLN
ncbi:MAG: PEP-utilizing enzyme [bacterium]